MNQCVLIHFKADFSNQKMRDFMIKLSRKLRVEGTAQAVDDSMIKIVMCGKKDAIEEFIDALHNNTDTFDLADIAVEPFYKHKEYRGVFRIIE